MELTTQLLLLISLLWLAVADWRHRSVSVWSLLLYGTLLLWSLINKYSATASLAESGINIVFLGLQFALVAGVLRLRKRDFSLRNSIGSGDLIFLLLSAMGWSTTIFLTAYLAGLIFGLVLAIGLQRGKPEGNFPIPLLTALGTTFALVLTVNWLFSY